MNKALAEYKKENDRLKETNQGLQERIDELEQEVKDAEEKIKNQEALWIKAFDIVSPKNATKKISTGKNVTFPAPVASKKVERVIDRPKAKANYKQNMKTMIHQKYMKKFEDQEKAHEKQINALRYDFATQIEELTEQMAEMCNNMVD